MTTDPAPAPVTAPRWTKEWAGHHTAICPTHAFVAHRLPTGKWLLTERPAITVAGITVGDPAATARQDTVDTLALAKAAAAHLLAHPDDGFWAAIRAAYTADAARRRALADG